MSNAVIVTAQDLKNRRVIEQYFCTYITHIIGRDGDKILASNVRHPRQTSVIAASETPEPGIKLAIILWFFSAWG